MNYTKKFFDDSMKIIEQISIQGIEEVAELLSKVKKDGGRIFFAGSGGGAGHSSHAACDFRKIADIESYSISDNISELTARVNDESWSVSYSGWLKVSRMSSKDCLFVMSVGGGDKKLRVSENLVDAIDFAVSVGANVTGIVGREGGYLKSVTGKCIVVPTVDPNGITFQVEGFQALIWHLLVSHPNLKPKKAKWESMPS